MYKLSLEKAKEPENKLPTFVGSWRKQGNSRKKKKKKKTSISAVLGYAKDFACVDHKKLWNILKYVGVPYHLTYLLRNLYAGQEITVRTGHGTTDRFKIGKGVQ